MNSIDWLKSVRENDQKPPVPPVPPDGTQGEKAVKTLIPPVAPCSSVYLLKKENNFQAEVDEKKCTTVGKVETSGGHRGNSTNHGVNDVSDHRVIRGNQGKSHVSETETATNQPPKPFLTSGGDLSIPFDSDPKYHWWKAGQNVEQTRADVLAWMAAERAEQNG